MEVINLEKDNHLENNDYLNIEYLLDNETLEKNFNTKKKSYLKTLLTPNTPNNIISETIEL